MHTGMLSTRLNLAKIRIAFRVLFLVCAVALLASCYSVQRITNADKFNGELISELKLVLHEPFTFDGTFLYYHFPAGEYLPLFKSEDGILFASVKPVIGEQRSSAVDFKGGIIVDPNTPEKLRIYVAINQGVNEVWDLDQKINFSIRR